MVETPYKVIVLDGNNVPLLVSVADLISTASGKGASLVGVNDAGNFFTGTTVEQVLQEIPNGTVNFKGLKIGDVAGGNYSEFEADGTMVAKGTATCYKDVIVPLLPKSTGVGNPTLSTFVDGLEQYKFAINDKVQLENAEAPHDWEQGTGIEVHVHWSNSTQDATARYVNFELSYTFANMLNGTTTDTVFPVNVPVTYEATIPANTPAFTNLYSTIIALDDTFMSKYKVGCGLILKIKRITSVGTAPSGDPFIFNLGIHYKSNTLGSRTRTSK